MLRIECPWCGARDEAEFLNGGEGDGSRPAEPHRHTDSGWTEYLFTEDNPRGPLTEYWFHHDGCRQWFVAVRDTMTHAVLETRAPTPGQGEA
ncbi:sarcosine oxidase subunit delta [Stakelama tenebrarum]|uniref:Sarcosine oxidase subunit delta n=1 Tax=Stakelama tenebrarum TaxID=2711215 RepID=A0A6G6Y5I7_9SPHN|nr:sarcosine oxidase subunit delta [Sphingosinithalassobacter tenebrarum]QIG80170.1 sarcosine oxidase subunit delta [Sphingosinithalassobacter tenebrarum]